MDGIDVARLIRNDPRCGTPDANPPMRAGAETAA